MDFLLWFFRDFLDGPLYIVEVIISVILICAGIGYFAEDELNKKREKAKFKSNYTNISNPNSNVNTGINNFQNNNPNYTPLVNSGNVSNSQIGQGVGLSSNMANVENNQVNINNK